MAQSYPTNYDFSKHWRTRIVPLLEHPTILKSIRQGVNKYLRQFPTCRERYKKNTPPASYSSRDYYACRLMDRKRELLLARLKQEGKLPPAYLKLERKIEKDEDDDQELFGRQLRMQERILKPYTDWNAIKYDLESYYLCGGCHALNPTLGLTLARLVEPTETWRVLSSNEHTTVINSDNSRVFDLIYWVLDGRIENHMFGDELCVVDPTLGGKQAYIDATK